MGRVTLFVVTLAIAFMLSSVCSNSANTTDNGSGLAIAGEQLDGKSLIYMGENMKSTLLKLLGKSFENFEQSFENFERKMNEKICEIDPCDQWSPWSKCSARLKNTFGFKSRSRVCWFEKHDACNRTGEQTVENDNNVCEGRCPLSYTFYNATNSCLKYSKEKLNQNAAEKVCKQDGGHLLNTDTEGKWNASVSIALSNNVGVVWIDGTRTSVTAKWVYLNGKDPEANGVTSKWNSGQPGNQANEFCRVIYMQSGTYYWHDSVCTSDYSSICEVT
ncbi:hypothetical protein DPMN_039978 [Dreissena polymorpha]|uniref:C-type lectin domain-containing protein n=1 Tax=Dreissena polymorpha TaxID=45954 RepID=A0A9D4CWV8_DREPO|nr:hypothetical protein DPMN_039978 [Dreissena polymorpha]